MLIQIPDLLTPEETATLRAMLEQSAWQDGKLTAGGQAASAKNNLQIDPASETARAAGEIILQALARNPTYTSAALPMRVLPPMFNRYDEGMFFGMHTDNAVRVVPNSGGLRMRADVSTTVFLTDARDYEGGELEILDTYGTQRIKGAAGSAVVYPSSSLHAVRPITKGARWASFFWAQSMVRSDEKRRMLYELDTAIQAVRSDLGDAHAGSLGVVSHYHNLLRAWAEVV